MACSGRRESLKVPHMSYARTQLFTSPGLFQASGLPVACVLISR